MYAFFTSAPVALGEMPKVEYKSDSEDEDDKGAILSLLLLLLLLLLSLSSAQARLFSRHVSRREDSLSLSPSALVFMLFFFFQNKAKRVGIFVVSSSLFLREREQK